jgi:hypothetical protein
MKIGGTMDEPSGSLSLLGSVTTLVGDALMKNVVSSKLTKLLGLKKDNNNKNNVTDSSGTVDINEISTSTETTKN